MQKRIDKNELIEYYEKGIIIFTSIVIITLTAMVTYAVDEGIGTGKLIFKIAESYLTILTNIGSLFTNIEEAHIINYLIVHLILTFIIIIGIFIKDKIKEKKATNSTNS